MPSLYWGPWLAKIHHGGPATYLSPGPLIIDQRNSSK
jgi:hypothetical protein